MVIGLALGYLEAYCMSDFSEENLLSAIEQTQVSLDLMKAIMYSISLIHYNPLQPIGISLVPAHIAYICRNSHLNRYDLSSVMSITVMGSSISSIYEREIFEKLPNLFRIDNVTLLIILLTIIGLY